MEKVEIWAHPKLAKLAKLTELTELTNLQNLQSDLPFNSAFLSGRNSCLSVF